MGVELIERYSVFTMVMMSRFGERIAVKVVMYGVINQSNVDTVHSTDDRQNKRLAWLVAYGSFISVYRPIYRL